MRVIGPTIPCTRDWNIQFKSFSCEVLYVKHTHIRLLQLRSCFSFLYFYFYFQRKNRYVVDLIRLVFSFVYGTIDKFSNWKKKKKISSAIEPVYKNNIYKKIKRHKHVTQNNKIKREKKATKLLLNFVTHKNIFEEFPSFENAKSVVRSFTYVRIQ